MQSEPEKLIRRKTGDWWQDDRCNWCAYCGRGLTTASTAAAKRRLTRDHVIPKSHGGSLTIPSCRSCNKAKGNRSAAEFMTSAYFAQNRTIRLETQWSLRDLWLAMAMASVKLALRHDGKSPDGA